MGLTIHYILSLKSELSPDVVHELCQRTTNYARKIGCAEVGEPLCVEKYKRLAPLYFPIGPKKQSGRDYCCAEAIRGWRVTIWPGEGCETAAFGLCQYPRRVLFQGGYANTGFKGGWLFQSFCKTQFARGHGWEHFLKCHKQVISLLDFWRGLGVREGER